jgi:predicted transcriptional regulator of viral defense system
MPALKDFDRLLAGHPVFTVGEAALFLDAAGPTSRQRVNLLLAYHAKVGHIKRVRRGLYVAVHPGFSSNDYSPDPFLLASRMSDDAILAYHTALEFHGRAYSMRQDITYLTRRAARSSQIGSYRFRPVSFPKPLRVKGKEDYGVAKEERAGLAVRVTMLERTLVDVLDRPNLSGSWEEIWRSLESIEFFDLSKVVEYALLLENATTAAKVGYFLEQHRDQLMAKESHLEPLCSMKPRRPHYLERSKRHAGQLIRRWNLVVPESVVNRSWAEIL